VFLGSSGGFFLLSVPTFHWYIVDKYKIVGAHQYFGDGFVESFDFRTY